MAKLIVNFLYGLFVLWQATQVDLAIKELHPGLSSSKRNEYARIITLESYRSEIDPLLVVSLIDRESDFRNLPENSTKDYGLMQLHWQHVKWFKGHRPRDLMDVSFNVHVGIAQMAYWKSRCTGKRGIRGHHWIGHYKWGNFVRSRRYDRGIMKTYKDLHREKQSTASDRSSEYPKRTH